MKTNEHSITTTHTHEPKDSRPKAYAFKHWNRDFENAQTRKQHIETLEQTVVDHIHPKHQPIHQ